MGKRDKQMNVRVEADFLTALDEIRAMTLPIPTTSDILHDLVYRERDRLKKQKGRK